MEKVISFIRVNKNDEDYTNNQAIIIATYIKKNKLKLNFNMELEVSIPNEEENIFELFVDCEKDCTIIVADLNVFGRTITNIFIMLNKLLSKGASVISINQNLDLLSKDDILTKIILGVIDMSIILEKDLMSLRTKEALVAKKLDGVHLGKPKGTIQKSKFDEQRDKIEELLRVGLSVRKISKLLGYNNHIGLNNYVKKRNIRNYALENEVLAS
jgi:DNA invertase Pin-like site-specific DNA recombinase